METMYPRKVNACDVIRYVTLVTSELSLNSCVVALTREGSSLSFLFIEMLDNMDVKMYILVSTKKYMLKKY